MCLQWNNDSLSIGHAIAMPFDPGWNYFLSNILWLCWDDLSRRPFDWSVQDYTMVPIYTQTDWLIVCYDRWPRNCYYLAPNIHYRLIFIFGCKRICADLKWACAFEMWTINAAENSCEQRNMRQYHNNDAFLGYSK